MPRLTHVRSMPATLARVTPAIAVNASDRGALVVKRRWVRAC